MAAKLKDIRQQLRQRMHDRLKGTKEWLQSVVRGYFQYHAVPANEERLKAFRQRSRWTWKRFLGGPPPVEILHPWPNERFAARHPR